MPRHTRTLLIALVAPVVVGAQEVGLHGSVSHRGESDDASFGVGASLGASMRLGDMLVDTALARRANIRVGFRISLSETHYGTKDYSLCADDCPPGSHDVDVAVQVIQPEIFALPYATARTRVEVNGGLARYRTRMTYPPGSPSERTDANWGFVTGVALGRRLPGSFPMWLDLAYTRHARPLAMVLDDVGPEIRHSGRAGITWRRAR